ncbi:MAG: hypothetical protein N2257_03900 [Thermodesulfovibrionales bacterium]|nr:hypothetical protein [Thermodesulfovibrionales bacterium]
MGYLFFLFALGNPVYTAHDPRYTAWRPGRKETTLSGSNQYAFRGLAIKAKWRAVTEDVKNHKKAPITDKRVLLGIAIFLIIIGVMALNPALSLLLFIISGVISIVAIIKGKGWVRVIALVICILSVILIISVMTKAKSHMDIYRKSIEELK